MHKLFPVLLFCVAVFIAGTAAFFSVKGIGLLFAGSFLPVVVMASSLEIGKLFAVSFLYRRWHNLPALFKTYLTVAVLLLVGITSLGIFGFLSDAYQETKSKVMLYESRIDKRQQHNIDLQNRITLLQTTKSNDDQTSKSNTQQYKLIYDEYVSQQNKIKTELLEQQTKLNADIDLIRSQPGGLFSNKDKKLKILIENQQPERDSISNRMQEIDNNVKIEYNTFLSKVDKLSQDDADVTIDVSPIYLEIESNNDAILELKEQINNTDIGSFRFIAQTVNLPVDDTVKWFTLIIVVVFDPLAMILMIGYNMYAVETTRGLKPRSIEVHSNTTPAGVIYKTKSK